MNPDAVSSIGVHHLCHSSPRMKCAEHGILKGEALERKGVQGEGGAFPLPAGGPRYSSFKTPSAQCLRQRLT